MKLSTRGRYGIHAMYDLACNYNLGPQPIKTIAERQGIPEAYLEQLFASYWNRTTSSPISAFRYDL